MSDQARIDLVTFRKVGLINYDVYVKLCELNGVDDPDGLWEQRRGKVSRSDQTKARAAERFAPYADQLIAGPPEPEPEPEPEQPKAVEADIPATVAEPEPESTRTFRKKSGRGGFGRW